MVLTGTARCPGHLLVSGRARAETTAQTDSLAGAWTPEERIEGIGRRVSRGPEVSVTLNCVSSPHKPVLAVAVTGSQCRGFPGTKTDSIIAQWVPKHKRKSLLGN